ncbi:hypothetical protein [Roseomonas fluvialis]|uniref:Uncharacterized protein n=1 Tax=Roseomonas fluvialis TaxID=1750527 RepID=A0ABM9SEG5_9PROT|nr:hypothetical protein [Roseomonas fluvialis]BDG74081.1 hypothetical protein Rmf_40100 [Roseomonas fluvialis]
MEHQTTTTAAPLRALLSEAAALRQRGDVGAAEALEADALRVVRASLTHSAMEAQA